ncbi:DNA polymerase I [Polynucleobacter paneuropaeus]|jgi:DNA polymerase-1|uniref:DNA polymerase I n=1 Tax=Polynucleobacter paneuropaeus TaxID=2527775 RepID=A0AAE3CHG2_9BURK|nr:DNA polymerase I [Polynucleobacter paneuropaeus]MBT8558869.1 DNA polymerase I [Polynucleobacter paneuropaeus]MBT8589464.1 DNA polymerase I [Polynucleobacter paneuropaeus]MBT8591165.1 DNA polymerase I [Polynucleobacter paneuropaeus]MBT8592809.1 DNA polymerase I [Polynucleobacter paneuropaeus]MBT8596555.1 DNA polymerase I [Polynucleobacter paneuropaeus]
MTKHRLLLIDGSSYLYRAFHAMPDLRNGAGDPTGAIYGMVNMMRRARSEIQADHIACIFDAKGKTFRDEMYPEYKAHRSPMPEDLVKQIEPIHALVKALGWPVLVVSGVEADDVIGTLACQASQAGWETIISTGDKDLAQLVNSSVSLINTMTDERLDIDGVIAKFGVPPERIVDYLSIIGDTVDNVPGVPKAGPKTANKWLAEFGDLDNLMANADQVKGVVGENLRAALNWLPQARQLITVKTDCDLSSHVPSLDELHAKPEDSQLLRELFERYAFKTWLREVEQGSSQAQAASTNFAVLQATTSPSAEAGAMQSAVEKNYECILDEASLDKWIQKIQEASLTAVDTETTSLDALAAQLVGISLSVTSGEACYIPVGHLNAPEQLKRDDVLDRLKPWLESKTHYKVGQNLKYDAHIFANYGITLQGVEFDTLLESYVLESHMPHNMDSLADRHLGMKTIKYEEVCGKGVHQIGFDQVDLQTATEYAAEDADITLRLHLALWPQIQANPGLLYIYEKIEMPAMRVLGIMERNGIRIDSALLAKQGQEIGKRLLALEGEIHQLAGQPFNIQSPKQIAEILFGQLELPVIKKTPSGSPSTDEEVLQKLAEDYPLPARILDYRSLAKLMSTYIEKLPRMADPQTGRVHTNFSQAVAVTGRLASSEPNLQNIPVRTEEGRRIREAFIPAPGCKLLSADYSQIELRIMAHIAEDANLLEAFATGKDVHQATAAEIFGIPLAEVSSEQRRYAKVINFGLIYGMSAFGLAGNLGIERGAAQNYIAKYFERYPGVAQYMERTRLEARDRGYVETVFGRRLWLPEIKSNGPRRQGAERAAINAPMQGTAADLIKLAMIAVENWIEKEQLKTKMLLQVHDELVFDVPLDEIELLQAKLPGLMCQVAQLKVPLVVSIGVGDNWEEAH